MFTKKFRECLVFFYDLENDLKLLVNLIYYSFDDDEYCISSPLKKMKKT